MFAAYVKKNLEPKLVTSANDEAMVVHCKPKGEPDLFLVVYYANSRLSIDKWLEICKAYNLPDNDVIFMGDPNGSFDVCWPNELQNRSERHTVGWSCHTAIKILRAANLVPRPCEKSHLNLVAASPVFEVRNKKVDAKGFGKNSKHPLLCFEVKRYAEKPEIAEPIEEGANYSVHTGGIVSFHFKLEETPKIGKNVYGERARQQDDGSYAALCKSCHLKVDVLVYLEPLKQVR